MTIANGTRLRVCGVLFIAVVLIGGCSPLMTRVPRADTTDSEHSLVTFLRPQAYSIFRTIGALDPQNEGPIFFDVWDREKLVGVLASECYIQYQTNPGEHLFLIAESEREGKGPLFLSFWRGPRWHYVKADLQKGKRYYIQANDSVNGVIVNPIAKDEPGARERIDVWLNKLQPTALAGKHEEEYAGSKRVYVRGAIAQFESGGEQCAVLSGDDWR